MTSESDKKLVQELHTLFMAPMKHTLQELKAQHNPELDELGASIQGSIFISMTRPSHVFNLLAFQLTDYCVTSHTFLVSNT
jgi:hypothetical protein